MTNHLGQQTAHRPAGESSLSLFLGLYLLILAFFILLVSLSTIEERKARAVMDSLSATFAGTQRPAGNTGGTSEGNQLISIEREIAGAFAALVRVVEVEVVKPGRLMRVGLPLAVVFDTGATAPRASLHPMFDRVVATLSTQPGGARVNVEFTIQRGTAAEERLLASTRADALAREMIARGAPPARLSIALARDGAARVWMTFRIDHDRPPGAQGDWF